MFKYLLGMAAGYALASYRKQGSPTGGGNAGSSPSRPGASQVAGDFLSTCETLEPLMRELDQRGRDGRLDVGDAPAIGLQVIRLLG